MLTFKTSKLHKQNETNLSTETESSLGPQGRRRGGQKRADERKEREQRRKKDRERWRVCTEIRGTVEWPWVAGRKRQCY